MKPSEQCKQAGLAGLNELAEITGQHEQTLIRWSKDKPKLFSIVLLGASRMNKLEILQLPDNSYAAIFSGETGSGEIATEEEAHNINGDTEEERARAALLIWGADEDITHITHC